MGSIRGSNQAPIITQRYLNTAPYAGDPSPGAVVSTAQVSGSIVQRYDGLVGLSITLDPDDANYYSDPAYQELYEGDYQYVKFDPASGVNAVQGQAVFWKGPTPGSAVGVVGTNHYLVTPLANTAAGLPGPIAGIALGNTQPGNFWFIQTAGIAQVKFKGTITKTTPTVDDLVYVDNAPSAFADVIADATNITSPQLKLLLGKAFIAAPTGGGISPVFLRATDYNPGTGGGGA